MMKLAQEQKQEVPECYDASDCCDSSTAKTDFVSAFTEQKNISLPSTGSAIELEHGIAPPPSKFLDLCHVNIRDVVRKVNHIHTGCVMLLEVIHESYRQINGMGTNLLIQDENGDCMMLSLYNYVASDEVPNDIFPVGMRFALLAPYMKNSEDGKSRSPMLRCDNPQCLVLYDDDEYVWKPSSSSDSSKDTTAKLREKGNNAFIQGDMEGANQYYTRALKHPSIDDEGCRTDKIACLSNRAEVKLREERWEEALADAQTVLSIQADHPKAKFRLARALSRLGQSLEAKRLGQEMLEQGSHNRSCVEKFVNECSRLLLEEGGTYNYDSMRSEARLKKSEEQLSFHAAFASPRVEIGVTIERPSGVSYRGCKAAEDIEEGGLIMANKAFAYVKENTSGIGVECHANEKTMGGGSGSLLVGQTVRKLWKCPSLGKRFYSLSGGEHLGEIQPENLDRVDLPRIRAILSGNTFGLMDESVSVLLNWKKIHLSQSEFESEVAKMFQRKGSGLWLEQSMLNHSCTPNCVWSQIGDHMFVNTTRAIEKDEELCILYTPLESSHEERTKEFADWIKPNHGFSCACNHCHLFRTRDDLRKLATEVDNAYKEGSRKTRALGIPMAVAAESVLPSQRRKFILKQFSHLPLSLQHTAIAKLHTLEGNIRKSQRDDMGALRSCEHAAEIGYAIRGNGPFEYLVDMWRIVGAAMACQKIVLAAASLESAWNHREFQSLSLGEAKSAFKDLTLKYTLPWWTDKFDSDYSTQVSSLVDDVCSKERKGKVKSNSKKKPREEKKEGKR